MVLVQGLGRVLQWQLQYGGNGETEEDVEGVVAEQCVLQLAAAAHEIKGGTYRSVCFSEEAGEFASWTLRVARD